MTRISVLKNFELKTMDGETKVSCDPFTINERIVLLRGDNGSGKSIFIKFLTGNLPISLTSTDSKILTLFNEHYIADNYNVAKNRGVVAVFQDDELISTFEVIEHFYLQHSRSNKINYAHLSLQIIMNILFTPVIVAYIVIRSLSNNKITEYIDKILSLNPDWGDKARIRRTAIEMFIELGFSSSKENIEETLRKRPTELFGGARAMVKICNAILNPKIKLLILDEAFVGVQRDTWEKCITALKKMSQERDFTIINVSHNEEECQYWEADGNLHIVNGVLGYRVKDSVSSSV